jgi:hypothetical protein
MKEKAEVRQSQGDYMHIRARGPVITFPSLQSCNSIISAQHHCTWPGELPAGALPLLRLLLDVQYII